MGLFSRQPKDIDSSPERDEVAVHGKPLENHEKGRWERSWPTIACGAGLFSDGYLNGYAIQPPYSLPGQPWAHVPLPLHPHTRLDTDITCPHRVIGQVNTILSSLYSTQYTHSSAQSNVNAIAFAGTVVGQLFFGYTSDHYSRKWSLMASTIILFIFAALSAGSYGGGSINGMLSALTAWRFLLGIGIGCVFIHPTRLCAIEYIESSN